MPVEVACPGCGSKLKAPDNMIGKKAKCKKCLTSFRIPGEVPEHDSASDSQMLSVVNMAAPAFPDQDESVPMARAVDDSELAAPAPPIRPVVQPSGSRPGLGSGKASPPAKTSGSTPGRPAVTDGSLNGSSPGRPGVPTRPSKPSLPAVPPTVPAAKPAPVPPPVPVQELLTLDEEPQEVAELTSVPLAPEPAVSDDPFAFTSNPAAEFREDPKSKKKGKDPANRVDISPKSPSKPKLPSVAEEPPAPAQDDPFSFNANPAPPAKSKTKKQERVEQLDEEQPKPRGKQKVKPAPDQTGAESFAGAGNAPAPIDANDPFSFGDTASLDRGSAGGRNSIDEDDDDSDEGESRQRKRKGEQGSNKMLMFAGILGVLAIGACIAGIIVFITKSQPEPPKKTTEKTEEPAPTPTPAPAPEAAKEDPNAGKKDPPKKETGKKEPGKKDSTNTPKREPKAPPEPGSVPMMGLPPNLPKYQFRPLPEKLKPKQDLSESPISIDVAFDKVKKFFPPLNRRDNDTVVVWQSSPGAGRADRLVVENYGSTGTKIGRLEFDADGKDVKCDVSADSKVFAAVVNGKVSAWNMAKTNTPLLEGFDPYADKPAHKKAGLAAVYIPKNSGTLLTVSTAGAMHLFEIAGKTQLGEFIPENGTPGKIVHGKTVAIDDAHTSVVVAIGGFIYQVSTQDLSMLYRKINISGEAGRSFGIAVLGTPGRIAYAIEADNAKSKDTKDQALLIFVPNDDAPVVFRWQDSAGEPTNVAWAGAELVVVGTTRGVVWFEQGLEGKKFSPLAMVEVPGGKGLHDATEHSHWYLIPTSANPMRSVILEIQIPRPGLEDRPSNPFPTWRLDERKLWE